MPYGYELILDLHGCNPRMFTRDRIETFMVEVCDAIEMQREDLHFWDDEGVPPEKRQTLPHTEGISAVQFILTSSIVLHTLVQLKAVYINIFSCKSFDAGTARAVAREAFEAEAVTSHFMERGRNVCNRGDADAPPADAGESP